MDLDLQRCLAKYRLKLGGVVHVGAHIGDEFDLYHRCGLHRQVWIEPQPAVFAQLRARLPEGPDVHMFNVACGDVPGTAAMHILEGNEGRSNSLLEPRAHLERFPEFRPGGTREVPVVRLDDLLSQNQLDPREYPLLVMDVQGFELHVLEGAPRYLAEGVRAIVSEVAAVELYAGGARVGELDALLAARGFARVRTKWAAGCSGDAFYLRRELLPVIERARIAILGSKGQRPPRGERGVDGRSAAGKSS